MSSPGGPRRSSSLSSTPFFSSCGGGGKSLKQIPVLTSGGKSTPPGQQTVCAKCNRHFRRSTTAKPNSDEYDRCGQCRNLDVGEWLQGTCVIS